ncbi:MAG: hypothetical protein ACOH18_04705 [Candidatus Saccharimonadaceae bacterium]
MNVTLELIRTWAPQVAIALTIVTTWIYFRKIHKKLAKPHVLTWAMLASITLSAAILQLSGGAGGWGTAPLLFAALTGYMFAFMAWRHGYMGVVTMIDYICIALALVAWAVWLVADQPALAVAALSVASVMSFLPTFRKSWAHPWDEPVSKYTLSTFRYLFTSIAVAHYNFVTGFYPTLWIGVNAGLVIFLLFRRRYVAQPTLAVQASAKSSRNKQLV